MADETLDLTPLQRAIERLDEGWKRYQQDISDTQIRDGLIQRFEFTYEISHKMLKRHLKTSYDMTPEQYRERWGLAADYPMVAPNYAKKRSQLAKKIGLGKRGKK